MEYVDAVKCLPTYLPSHFSGLHWKRPTCAAMGMGRYGDSGKAAGGYGRDRPHSILMAGRLSLGREHGNNGQAGDALGRTRSHLREASASKAT